jgi:hypothetical protein
VKPLYPQRLARTLAANGDHSVGQATANLYRVKPNAEFFIWKLINVECKEVAKINKK